MWHCSDMPVDFRGTRTELNTISILVKEVERAECWRYLSAHLRNRLDWKCNTEVVYKEGQSRLYFLRKVLHSASCCIPSTTLLLQVHFLQLSDQANKESWFCAGDCSGATVIERQMLQRLLNIMDNTWHPLHNLLVRQHSVFSWRLLQLHCNKDHYRKSFLTTITVYNDSPLCWERRLILWVVIYNVQSEIQLNSFGFFN